MEIDLPEVRTFTESARFFSRDGVEYVEISLIGLKDTVVHKVKPEHMARFRAAWDAYCDGRPMARRAGIPLTDLPEINAELAEAFIRGNVHNLEEVAALTDHHCQGLGHGVLTIRKKALQYVAQKQMEAQQANRDMVAQMSATVRTSEEAQSEMSELRTVLDEQAKKIDALTNALLKMAEASTPKRKPGRPPKVKNGSQHATPDRHPNV